MSRNAAKHLLRSTTSTLRRFGKDTSGVGAVEFAILAPLLLMLYIGSFEVTQGLSASKRTARAAGVISDLVSREDSVTPATLSTVTAVAQSIYAPFDAGNAHIVITGIAVDSTGAGTVAWSWTSDGSAPYSKGSEARVPEALYRTGAAEETASTSSGATRKVRFGDTSTGQVVVVGGASTGSTPSSTGSSTGSTKVATIDESFFVRTEVSYPFKLLSFMPGLLPTDIQNITLQREYFFRQRTNEVMPCDGCADNVAS